MNTLKLTEENAFWRRIDRKLTARLSARCFTAVNAADFSNIPSSSQTACLTTRYDYRVPAQCVSTYPAFIISTWSDFYIREPSFNTDLSCCNLGTHYKNFQYVWNTKTPPPGKFYLHLGCLKLLLTKYTFVFSFLLIKEPISHAYHDNIKEILIVHVHACAIAFTKKTICNTCI